MIRYQTLTNVVGESNVSPRFLDFFAMHLQNIILFLFLCILALNAAAEISVYTSFNPNSIKRGQQSYYVIEIVETRSNEMPKVERIKNILPPEVDNLQLLDGQIVTSQQSKIHNLNVEYSHIQTLMCKAEAGKEGVFTVPSFTFQYKGETLRAPAASLEVFGRSAEDGSTLGELVSLRISTSKKFSVGKTVPIRIQLLVPQGIKVKGISKFDRGSDTFIISALPKNYSRSAEVIHNQKYNVFTWPLNVTPMQSGKHDLDFQFELITSPPNENGTTDRFISSAFSKLSAHNSRQKINSKTEVEVAPHSDFKKHKNLIDTEVENSDSIAKETDRNGIDIIFSVDLSSSMKALDLSIQDQLVTRLDAVKSAIESFILKCNTDRIGLIAFAKEAYVVNPLTLNYNDLIDGLSRMEIGKIDGSGTAVGMSLGTSLNSLRKQENTERIVILLTDGDNNAGALSPIGAANIAKAVGIKIYTIIVGQKGQVSIPETTSQGDVMRDEEGKIIYKGRKHSSDYNENELVRVAEITDGEFFLATNYEDLEQIYLKIYEQIDALRASNELTQNIADQSRKQANSNIKQSNNPNTRSGVDMTFEEATAALNLLEL